jgi:hypothetical protein
MMFSSSLGGAQKAERAARDLLLRRITAANDGNDGEALITLATYAVTQLGAELGSALTDGMTIRFDFEHAHERVKEFTVALLESSSELTEALYGRADKLGTMCEAFGARNMQSYFRQATLALAIENPPAIFDQANAELLFSSADRYKTGFDLCSKNDSVARLHEVLRDHLSMLASWLDTNRESIDMIELLPTANRVCQSLDQPTETLVALLAAECRAQLTMFQRS